VGERLRVALVFGGRSGEHEVSIVSARSVAAALDAGRYEVVPMAIDRTGRWADPATAVAALYGEGATVDRAPEFEGVSRLDPRLLSGEVDVVLPILHGPYGEDGTIQGLCEMLDLPYTGCGLAASAVTMDKVLSKRLLLEAGLPTPGFVAATASEWEAGEGEVRARCLALPFPLFVKPARLGSSVGISKVKAAEQLRAAVEGALAYDDTIIVEEGIPAREIEVAVLGGELPFASVPGEVIPGHEFYDYADKYLDNDCQLLAPAPLDEAVTERIRELAVRAFGALGCSGMARVDLFLDRRDGKLWVNELNTIPGFTSISMYPRLLELSGVPYGALLDRLIELALTRHARRRECADAALRPLAERAR
jgi:D-alanine-D-alanine ligase